MAMAIHRDVEEIRRAAALFLGSGCVVELRAPKTERDGTISGYFSDPAKLVTAAANIRAPGVYVTLNPVVPDLLARADNRVKARAQTSTGDAEILRRSWLLLDFDPRRPAGISATEAEHDAALKAAIYARDALDLEGWARPVFADSGNGGHLLYRIDCPNAPESTDLIQKVLRAAAQRFNTRSVEVDISVYNASRISKLYGTVAAKGDSTEERPHRVSRILELPAELLPVRVELLQALAAEVSIAAPAAAPQRPSAAPVFDLAAFMSKHGIAIHRGPVDDHGSDKWVLDACPFNPAHRHPDAAIFRQPSGRLGFKCLHNSCADKDWKQFREFYEPGSIDRPKFVPRPVAAPGKSASAPSSEAQSDRRDKIPSSPADAEAAADAAIAADDLVAAMRLAQAVGVQRPAVRAVIVAKLKQHFKRRWMNAEFAKAMKEAADGANSPPPPDDDEDPPDSPDGPNLLFFPLTDAGNGERLVALWGNKIRYCVEMRRWLIWDGVRWCVDEMNVMRQAAKATARLLYVQAKQAGESKHQLHARASESYAAVTAALGSAATEAGIPISAAQLDQHPFLLNCPNGVVDLRDGTLLPHNRDFLITKLCPVPYQPKAECHRFVAFLQWAMGANPEAEVTERTVRLVGFLQRAFGYAITADVSEKAVFILHGERGNNGKTTLLTLFRELLGKDYSGQLVIDTVMSMKNQDATARADLADLRGVRLVVTSEVEKEHKLNEGKIKYITAGMGSIKSCRKYENPIEFAATHKLFMDCNHRPVVRGVDDAIWRRLKLIPFEVTVTEEEKDLNLGAKLRAESAGILAWAVRGCMAWFKDGLGDPPEVSHAGQEWREHDDPLKEFLDDCCETGDGLFVRTSDLAAGYGWWARQNRERWPLGKEAFCERLEAKGFRQSRSRRIDDKQSRTWERIELRTEVTAAIRKASSSPGWLREEE